MSRRYAREDDFLRKPLLGEGKALGELFRRPLIHGALRHPDSPDGSCSISGATVVLLAVCTASGEGDVGRVQVGGVVSGGPQLSNGQQLSWSRAQEQSRNR
jgi:hypothetical protein